MMLANEGRSVDDAKQWGLTEEMDYLDRMQRKERQAAQMVKLIISLSTFLLFWVLGAVVFKYAGAYALPVASHSSNLTRLPPNPSLPQRAGPWDQPFISPTSPF